jgi:cell division protein FtsB
LSDIDRLKRENTQLRKQIQDFEKLGGNSGSGDALTEENKALRREVKDLRSALAREPVYADIVKELKEAKMALALELMKYQRGDVSPLSASSAPQ